MTKEKVVSGIVGVSYSKDTLYFDLWDYPTRLYYKNCPIEFFDMIDNSTEYLLWQFTYSPSSHKIYSLKTVRKGYIAV